jgi:hypothetical protein
MLKGQDSACKIGWYTRTWYHGARTKCELLLLILEFVTKPTRIRTVHRVIFAVCV